MGQVNSLFIPIERWVPGRGGDEGRHNCDI